MELFVHSVPYDATENELLEVFQQYGAVERVHIARDRDTGRSRGYAFITMPDEDEAINAVQGIDGSQFGSRRIRAKVSEPHERT